MPNYEKLKRRIGKLTGGLIFLAILTTVCIVLSIIALTNSSGDSVANGVKRNVHIPASAVRISEDIYHLGSRDFKGRKNVNGYAIIHRHEIGTTPDEEGAHVSWCNPISQGARWKTAENFGVDPTNTQGLSSQFVFDAIEKSMSTWNTQTAFNIFGNRLSPGIVDGADTNSPDGKNELLFGTLAQGNTIAVTFLWGVFGGPILDRELLEADVVFNDAFMWGNATTSMGVMDLQNIATHELGHYTGLGHPALTVACSETSMFATATFDETKKSTLEPEDALCICELYGDAQCQGNNEDPPKSSASSLSFSIIFISTVTGLLSL